MFIVGAVLTPEMIESIPRYDVWAKAEKCGLKHSRADVEDLFTHGRRRRLGLYRIEMSDLLTAYLFQALAKACVIVISKNPGFLSNEMLRSLYDAARPDASSLSAGASSSNSFAGTATSSFKNTACSMTRIEA